MSYSGQNIFIASAVYMAMKLKKSNWYGRPLKQSKPNN